MRIRIRYKTIPLKLITIFFLFQNALEDNLPKSLSLIAAYADEIIAIIMLIFLLFSIYIKKYKMSIFERRIAELMLALALIGTVSSIKYKIQPLFPTVVDGLTCSKFVIVFLGFYIVWGENKSSKTVFRDLNGLFRIVGIILFTLVIINVFIKQIFIVYDYRFFIYSQTLFFGHSADLAFVCMNGLLVLIYNSREIEGNFLYMILYTLTAISTMRYKEIAVIIMIWLLYLYLVIGRIKSKMLMGLGSILAMSMFGYDQFIKYYLNTDQARALLTITGVKIANKLFPFGAGFGSFGSHISRVYYSSLYDEYALSSVWGLSRSYSGFINDTFISTVLGQFGWLGLLIIVLMFGVMIKECMKIKNNYYFACSMSMVAYLCISVLGTTSIFNPISIYIAITLSNWFAVYNNAIQ